MSMPPRFYKVDGKKVTCADVAERLKISHPAAHKRLSNALARSSHLTWRALGEGAPLSRAQQILRFVVGLGRRAKLDEVIDEIARIEPHHTDRAQIAMTVAAQMAQLYKAGKLDREGSRCHFTYGATSETFVDRRKSATQAAHAAPMAKAPKASRPSPAPKTKADKKSMPEQAAATPAAPPAKRPGEFRIVNKPAPFVVPNANLTRPRSSALDSAQIAADIAAFEARGGRIQRFKPGESSQSIRDQNDAYLAARGLGAARQRASARIAIKARASNDETLDADDQVDVA
jgi:hypothetical protein